MSVDIYIKMLDDIAKSVHNATIELDNIMNKYPNVSLDNEETYPEYTIEDAEKIDFITSELKDVLDKSRTLMTAKAIQQQDDVLIDPTIVGIKKAGSVIYAKAYEVLQDINKIHIRIGEINE